MIFFAKQISGQAALGEQIAARRSALGYTREDAARLVRLPIKYVIALEEGAYECFPGAMYAGQYMRVYNTLLGFSAEETVRRIATECALAQTDGAKIVRRQNVTRVLAARRPFVSSVRHMALFASAAVAIIVLVISVAHFFAPPTVEVTIPQEGVMVARGAVDVVGWTSPESDVTINGQPVEKTQDGNFQERITMRSGMNTLTIVAQKKHGWPRIVERKVLVE